MDDLAAHLASILARDRTSAFDSSTFEQLVLAYVDHNGRTWMQCKAVLREFKVLKDYEPRIRVRANELRGIPSIGANRSAIMTIRDVWPDAPVSSGAEPPVGWGIGEDTSAIYRKEQKTQDGQTFEKHVCVSYDPIVITRRIKHIDTHSIMLELAWRTGGKWHSALYERDKAFSSRDIVHAAKDGAPVGSDNAMAVVEWLRAYEHHNIREIPPGYANSSMGWQGDDTDFSKHGFLCGSRQIGGNGKVIELADNDSRGAHEISQAGTLDAWRDAVAIVDQWPMVRIGLYASLAAPLIAILEAPNCIVEWCGDTSAGKTVTLKVAQSCWKNGASKPPTWNTTVVGLEARATMLNDMPFIIDDTAQVAESKRRDLLTSAVYMLESGYTRTRGTKDMSERPSKTWRTIVLSTGEYMLAEHAGTGGASARVLTFWGAPLGEPSEETGEKISKMMSALRRNYGHAGPLIVKYLCEHRDEWDSLREEYAKLTHGVKAAIRSPAAMRLSETVALLEVTAKLAHKVLGLKWRHKSMLDDMLITEAISKAVGYAGTGADKPRLAWEHVVSVAESRRSQWIPWGDGPTSKDEPSGGWLGWRRLGHNATTREAWDDGSDLLAWHPSQLKRVLQDAGFPLEATMRTWRDRGVLIADRGRTTTSRKCSGTTTNHRVYLIKLNKTPWDE